MNNRRIRYASLDCFKIVAALLVVAIHISPLSSLNETADFVLTRIWARTAVPFFLMVTGFFVLPRCMKENGGRKYLLHALKKLGILYCAAVILYLPVNVYTGYFKGQDVGVKIVKDLMINGTFYHLWYMPAAITGLVVVYLLLKYLGYSWTIFSTLIFYVIGLFGDSYYGVIENVPVVKTFYDGIFSVAEYTRNGLFMAPVFLMMGYILAGAQKKAVGERFDRKDCAAGLAVFFVLLNMEGLTLHFFNVQRHDSMYIFLLPVMFFLFQLILYLPGKDLKTPGDLPMYIYILHPLCLILVRGVGQVLKLTKYIVDISYVNYIIVVFMTVIVSLAVIWIKQIVKKVMIDGKSLD